MSLLLEELKGLPNTLNFLLFLGVVCLVFYRTKKKRLGGILVCIIVVCFLLASTSFVPRFAMSRLEVSYDPFALDNFPEKHQSPVLVHVLGAGYSLDPTLPPNSQLSSITLGRLIEGLRICHQLPESLLICSGYSSLGLESQASVVKRTAIALGFDSTRIHTLTSPGTTEEEARALSEMFGTDATVIVVTDAVHMPRAMRLFKNQRFNPIAAPTNFITKNGPRRGYLGWMPSVRNIMLTDQVLHEALGNLKSQYFNFLK